jgi:DNA repair exonuclease SbcCD ATPase subunit
MGTAIRTVPQKRLVQLACVAVASLVVGAAVWNYIPRTTRHNELRAACARNVTRAEELARQLQAELGHVRVNITREESLVRGLRAELDLARIRVIEARKAGEDESNKAWRGQIDHLTEELASAEKRATELAVREKEAGAEIERVKAELASAKKNIAQLAEREKEAEAMVDAVRKAAKNKADRELPRSSPISAQHNVVATSGALAGKNAVSECPVWPPHRGSKRSIRVVVVGDVSFARDIKKVCQLS